MNEETTTPTLADVWRLFRETDAQIKETGAQIKETNRELRRMEGRFGDQWGQFIEALVEPNALKLFRGRGIDVQYVYRRAEHKVNGEQMELDLLLENGQETVVVEVKSKLRVEDVNEFLVKLQRFPTFFPRLADRHTYGAVAGLSFVGESDKYAYRQGLFVLGVVGEGLVEIRNDAGFRPKDFRKEN